MPHTGFYSTNAFDFWKETIKEFFALAVNYDQFNQKDSQMFDQMRMVAKLCHTFSSKALAMNVIHLMKIVNLSDENESGMSDNTKSIKELARKLMKAVVMLKANDNLHLYSFAFELRKMDTEN